jgi:hypothetical protein
MLLKTRYTAYQTGGSDNHFTEYGWLVVSCHWLRRESHHAVVDPMCFDSYDDFMVARRLLDREFDSSFTWPSPPASVQPLIEYYGFTEPGQDDLVPSDGVAAAIRHVVRSCQDCGAVQASIRNLIAPVGEKDNLDVSHYCRGIAVVHNVTYSDERGRTGSHFAVPCISIGGLVIHDGVLVKQQIVGTDWGCESQRIDGILLVSDEAVATAMLSSSTAASMEIGIAGGQSEKNR